MKLGSGLAIALQAAVTLAAATEPVLHAPNVVVIAERLVTSGQPRAEALAGLAAQGYGAVVYLAPPTVSDAVSGEADILRRQGLEFVNVPIDFGKPTAADFEAFTVAMGRLRERKLLVHCQVNFRASSMTFLWRVIVGRERPETAYEAVARVWSPDATWKAFMRERLRQADVAFEPY